MKPVPRSKRAFQTGQMPFKPHTVVVQTNKQDGPYPRFFEIITADPYEPGYYLVRRINIDTGAIRHIDASESVDELEPIAPTHPVYIKWAARRLADRLEGKDV